MSFSITTNGFLRASLTRSGVSMDYLIMRDELREIIDAADATLKFYDVNEWEDSDIKEYNVKRAEIFRDEVDNKTKKKKDNRYLYLIHNTIQNTLKIGVSADANQRLRSLQVATSDYLTLIFSIKGKAYLEKDLHNEFADIRLASEWFRYDKRIIERFNGLRYERMD